MKSRTIEIIDNHIKALEEELEWYQAKNREWQEESDKWIEKTEWIQQEADGGRFAGYHRADVIKTLFDELRAKLSERRYTGIRIDGTLLDFVELQQENARLRDQLRWHSMDELPEKTEWYISRPVLLWINENNGSVAIYHHVERFWTDYKTKSVIHNIDKHSRWCYIPDDNQGTDCTKEGE